MGTRKTKRRHKRTKMVLPIRVWAKDVHNKPFNELAHTLDITPSGARIGAIHHDLKIGDKLTIQYHQRKILFRVVWIKPLEGTKEYQLGVEADGAIGAETWGIELSDLSDEYSSETVTA